MSRSEKDWWEGDCEERFDDKMKQRGNREAGEMWESGVGFYRWIMEANSNYGTREDGYVEQGMPDHPLAASFTCRLAV